MAYAVYSFASQYTDTGLSASTSARARRTWRSCVEICVEQIGEIAAGRLRKGELDRAKESLKGRIMLSLESTSNRMSRLGKSLVADTELLTLNADHPEIDAVDEDELAELAAVLLAPERLSAAASGRTRIGFRAAVAREPGSRRARGGVKLAVFGAEGKVGRALVPRARAAGHEVTPIEIGDPPDVRGLDAAVDFTTPEAAPAERPRCARAGRLVRRRHDRLGSGAARRARARSGACASSSRRTSRSARC